jgi:transcriptional regulator of acetoin/glycerol metabolism
VLERACALAAGFTITATDIRLDLDGADLASCADEDLYALVALNGGTVAAAARRLGVPRTTLRDRIRRAVGCGAPR